MDQSAYIQQNEEIRAFNEMARSFARKELLGHVHEHEYPYRRKVTGVMKMAIEAGLFGITLPITRPSETGSLNCFAASGVIST